MRFLGVMLVVVLVGGPAVPELPDRGDPLGDAALSADLVEAGYRNGYIPDDLLVEVDSHTRKRCFLEKEASEAWRLLAAHALHDDIRLEAVSCYRSFKAQESSYNYNCPVQDVPVKRSVTEVDEEGIEQTTVVVDYVSRRVCKVQTARPGNSNHSWGRAVDVTSRRRLLSCRSKTFRWLQEHAPIYGWVHPAWAGCRRPLEEPWHWEWAGTIDQPTRVRHFNRVA